MKICPTCARSFADGFTYCPQDATALAKYDLRAHLQSKTELQFLLKHESFAARLRRELVSAVEDLQRNPRGYLASLLRGDGSPRRRKRLLHAGAATAVIAYASIALTLMLLGILNVRMPRGEVMAGPEKPEIRDGWKIPILVAKPEEAARKSGKGRLGGSLRESRRPGGGGGRDDGATARKGAPPQASPIQLLKPNLDPPRLNPALPTVPTIVVDAKSLLKIDAPIGLLGSRSNAHSLGDGEGPGIGPGRGPGYGPGLDGNTGGGKNKRGGETTDGLDDGPLTMTPRLRPTILHKEKAAYTEEARRNRVEGAVVLSVTFGADGRLHDIRTVRGLSHGLTENAIAAALRIRFTPAIRDGRPVSVRGNLEFSFALY
jgi:TonB family protein